MLVQDSAYVEALLSTSECIFSKCVIPIARLSSSPVSTFTVYDIVDMKGDCNCERAIESPVKMHACSH